MGQTLGSLSYKSLYIISPPCFCMEYRERILNLVKSGPVQPTSLSKVLNTNSLMASAMLSEMASKGLIRISSLKIGSSPVYYSPEHPEHLLNYIDSLNEKDRKTAELLREKKIFRDSALSPLQKVCARNIKDFALPLEVTLGESKEIFWKWFLLSDDEAGILIKELLESELPKSPEQPMSAEKEQKVEIKEEQKVIPEKPAVCQRKESEFESLSAAGPEIERAEPRSVEVQQTVRPVFVDMGDPFFKKIKSFFEVNNIIIHEAGVVKKKAEFDLVIEIPTPLGNLFYFCKAKNNKRISNSDLSRAYVQGQLKKLPVVFLSTGVLTKPAQVFMNDLKGLTVTRL